MLKFALWKDKQPICSDGERDIFGRYLSPLAERLADLDQPARLVAQEIVKRCCISQRAEEVYLVTHMFFPMKMEPGVLISSN